ncbi:MAG: ABC transporter substrate-binding protein [Clostridia bacterium]|nr:ABC transporter substrate-binding protein [Clostridia bacterium]
MKKFARIASLIMALAMVLTCFVGCTADKEGGATPGEDGLVELKLGCIGPLTGDYANYGTSVQNGVNLAIEEINAAGGVNGFKLTIDFQDSQGDPDSATAAYGKLMDDGMKISLGTVLSGEMTAVSAAAIADEILLLSPSASAKDAITGNDSAFRVCFNDPQQGTVSADYIADNKLATKVAVFYQSDLDYSNGLYENFKAQCAKRGIEIVETTTFTKSTNTDFSTQINAIKASGAELVFIPIYAAEASTFLTQAYGKLTDIPLFGCDGLDGILTKVSDTKYAENVMMLTPFSADDTTENVKKFVDSYKKNFNATPDQFAADGYDAVYAVVEALKKAEITPDNFEDDDFNSKMVAAMTQITVKGVTGTMTWTADGETNKAAKAMIIHDGVASLYTSEK